MSLRQYFCSSLYAINLPDIIEPPLLLKHILEQVRFDTVIRSNSFWVANFHIRMSFLLAVANISELLLQK